LTYFVEVGRSPDLSYVILPSQQLPVVL